MSLNLPSAPRSCAIVLVACLLGLGGCAATVKRPSSDVALAPLPPHAAAKLVVNVSGSKAAMESSDWAAFRDEWRDNFVEQGAIAGVPFELQDGASHATGEAGTLLSVHVADYRFLRPGTRYLAGVFAGNAYIESTLTFSDLKTGEVIGKKTANTSSSALQGVFSPMTNKQVEAIAVEVYQELKSGKPAK